MSDEKNLHNELEKIKVAINAARDLTCEAQAGFCCDAVQRNGAIVALTWATGDGEREQAINDLLATGATSDAGMKNTLDRLAAQMSMAWAAIHDVTRLSESTWKRTLNLMQRMNDDVRAAESRLTDRLKEHAVHSPQVRETVWAITDGKCIYCDVELTRERDPNEPHRCFEVDHVVPKASGGPDHISNYVPSCARCNCSKSDRSVFDFLRKRNASPDLRVVGGSEQ